MTEPTEKTEEKDTRKLTEAEWVEIVELWELGEVKLEDLSERFGISAPAISKGLKKRGAVKGSKAAAKAAAVAAAVVASEIEEAVDTAAERRKRVEETKKQHYEWTTMLAKMAMATIAEAKRAGKPLSAVAGDLKALQSATNIVARARDERYTILDMHNEVDEKGLPDLVIRDLTDDEIEDLRSRDDDGLLTPEIELPTEIEDIIAEGGE